MNLEKRRWTKAKIGNIGEVQYGSSIKSTDSEDGYRTFRMNELIDGYAVDNGSMKRTVIQECEFNRYKLYKGDVLFNRTNSYEHVGRTGVFLLDGDYIFASYLLRISVDSKKVKPLFLNTLMNSSWFQTDIKRYATKAVGQANINATSLSNFEIPLPPLDEQERIVELFQSIEQAIVHVEGQETNLLKLKNQLLRDLFGEKQQLGNYLSVKDFEKVKFEKIALNISERVEPKQTDLEIYVGLEHLDSDDLVIRRKGKPEDVIGTKLKIFKGDIIFGKRRAYLRKVAVADFEGIVSAHSMVLRANEENIEKDFLPYFIQSDEFMNRAVQISEGSLSPTIKWKTLAQQEFILPRREKQGALIGVFKLFDETRELVRLQKETLKKLKQKLLNEILG